MEKYFLGEKTRPRSPEDERRGAKKARLIADLISESASYKKGEEKDRKRETKQ